MVSNVKFSIIGQLWNDKEFDSLVTDIKPYYQQPHRFYHNANHIEHGLRYFIEYYESRIPRYVLLAWLAHDMCYVAHPKGSELASITILKSLLINKYNRFYKNNEAIIEKAIKYIEATIEHKIIEGFENDEDLKIFLDVDMMYLAEEYDFFLHCRNNIRKEYIIYGDNLFVQGSIAFCENVLKEDKIFKSKYFENKNEIAINNLEKYIQYLKKS